MVEFENNAPKIISSFQNDIFKKYLALSRSSKNSELFLVEGEREIRRAIAMKFPVECVLAEDAKNWKGFAVVQLAPHLLAKLLVRESKESVVAAFFKPPQNDFFEFLEKANDVKLTVLENCEKPGNLGAVLRSAVAFGVSGVVLLGKTCDPWQANCIRASLGAVFEIPIFTLENEVFFAGCKKYSIETFGAYLNKKSRSLFEVTLPKSLAFIFGAEDKGLSEKISSQVSQLVMIPMWESKTVDSLNLAVSTAVFSAELFRRRIT